MFARETIPVTSYRNSGSKPVSNVIGCYKMIVEVLKKVTKVVKRYRFGCVNRYIFYEQIHESLKK
jgi:hypothetical protein